MITWVASFTDLITAQSGESRGTDARVSVLSVSFLTDAAVEARIESTSLTGGDTTALGSVADQFVMGIAHHQTADATDEAARESSHAVDGSEVGHSADEERLEQVEPEETSRYGAGERSLAVDAHAAVLLVAVEFHRVPFAHFDAALPADDGRTGANVETEFRNAVVQAKRDEVPATACLLTVVQDHACKTIFIQLFFFLIQIVILIFFVVIFKYFFNLIRNSADKNISF